MAVAVAGALALGACGGGDTKDGTTVDAVSIQDARAALTKGIDSTSEAKQLTMRITGSGTGPVGDAFGSSPCSTDAAPTAPSDSTVIVSLDTETGTVSLRDASGGPRLVATGVLGSGDQPVELYASATQFPSWGLTRPWVHASRAPSNGTSASGSYAAYLIAWPATATMASASAALSIVDPRFAGSATDIDPAKVLQRLRDAASNVTSAGPDTVDGRPAEHLLLELDPKLIGAAFPPGSFPPGTLPDGTEPSEAGAYLAPLVGFDRANAEAWVANDGRVARLRVTASGTTERPEGLPSDSGFPNEALERMFGPWTATSDVVFTGYGEPVPSGVPAPDQVIELNDLPANTVIEQSDPFCGASPARSIPECASPPTLAPEGMSYGEWTATQPNSGMTTDLSIPEACLEASVGSMMPGGEMPEGLQECLEAMSLQVAPIESAPGGTLPSIPSGTFPPVPPDGAGDPSGSPVVDLSDLPPECQAVAHAFGIPPEVFAPTTTTTTAH